MEEPADQSPDQSPNQRKASLVDHLGYATFCTAEWVLRMLPLELVSQLGAFGGVLFFALSRSYRRLAARNLEIAFGREKSAKERRALLWQHAARLGANFTCSVKLATVPRDELERRVEIVGKEHVDAVQRSGRGILFVIGHLGPWELLAQNRSYLPEGSAAGAVYQRLSNPLLDQRVRQARERIGHRLFERREGFFAAIAMLRDGGSLGVLADQHAGDAGVYTAFFGRMASTTTLPLLLARRSKAALLALGIETVRRGHWRLTISPVQVPSAGKLESGLNALNLSIEQMIRRSPADWFWVHNRWKTPSPAFLLHGQKRGIVEPPVGLVVQPFRVLVRGPNWLGDACMAVPAVRAIKRGRPDLELTILTPAKLADVWRAVPEVDAVLCREGKESIFSVARKIKQAGIFSVGIIFPNSPRTAMEMSLGGVLRVVGYAARWRKFWIDQEIPRKKHIGPPGHHVEHYLQIAHRVGADCEERTIFAPLPEVTTVAPAATAPIRLGLCAGAEYGPAKRWPLDRFAETAKRIQEKYGKSVEWVLFGAPGEKAMGEELAGMLGGNCRNLVGATSLVQLMDELRACRLLLSNDTGTMHLAALLGRPVVAIFGSTEPAWTRPLGRQHVILREHVECSPCFLRQCPLDLRCMTAITPERVAHEIEKFLMPISSDH